MSEIFQALGAIMVVMGMVAFISSYFFLCSEVFSLGNKVDRIIKYINEKDAVKSDKTEAK